MLRLYFLIFWIPAVASLLLLMAARRTGLFPRIGLLVMWYVVALALQVVGQTFSPAWTIGLVFQVLLALYVTIRLKLA